MAASMLMYTEHITRVDIVVSRGSQDGDISLFRTV